MKIRNISDRFKNYGFFKRYLRKQWIRKELNRTMRGNDEQLALLDDDFSIRTLGKYE